jgi:hypothetical protein
MSVASLLAVRATTDDILLPQLPDRILVEACVQLALIQPGERRRPVLTIHDDDLVDVELVE